MASGLEVQARACAYADGCTIGMRVARRHSRLCMNSSPAESLTLCIGHSLLNFEDEHAVAGDARVIGWHGVTNLRGQDKAARAGQARAQRTHHALTLVGSAALADNCGNGHVTPRGVNSPVDLEPEPVWRSGKAPCENVLRSLRVGKAGRASTQSYYIFRAQAITQSL